MTIILSGTEKENVTASTARPLRILHTSDWHIGNTLYEKRRREEYDRFFQWLLETLDREDIDVLLVAGDIFDSTTPSGSAQELYYDVLRRAYRAGKRQVIVTSGNHDSASMLQAPRNVLKCINVHVTGVIGDDPANDIIAIKDENGLLRLVVCAVPFLRSRDVRTSEAGESSDERNRKQQEGIVEYYKKVAQLAREKYPTAGVTIPLVGMGHLYITGNRLNQDKKTRGLLQSVDPEGLQNLFDYLALGHLHIPQKVGRFENIQYSGSPIPVSFSDCQEKKHVCVIEFDGHQPHMRYIEVPVFQELKTIQGDWNKIEAELDVLRQSQSRAWLEIVYEGKTLTDLSQRIEDAIASTSLEVLRLHDTSQSEADLSSELPTATLSELDPETVFMQLLKEKNIDESQHDELMSAYRELLTELAEQTPNEKE